MCYFFLFSFFLFLFVNIFSLLEWKKERERGCERERRLYVREREVHMRERSLPYIRERGVRRRERKLREMHYIVLSQRYINY